MAQIKVLHINTFQNGGAALCAIRINHALTQEGVDSRMLFAEGDGLPQEVRGAVAERDELFFNRNWLHRKFRKLLVRFPWYMDFDKFQGLLDEANKQHLFLHHPFSCYRNIAHHPLVEWADVIHLHWVSGFIDYPTFFSKVKKPIVWTLHDKNPLVGVQHFNSDFHPVPDELKAIDSYCKEIKRKSIAKAKKLAVVTVSELMINESRSSSVLNNNPSVLIHNGVDTTVFHRYVKESVREELGLDSKTKVFLFSAYWIFDKNKGLDRVVEAIEKIDIVDKMLICIGDCSNGSLPHVSFPVNFTGMLNDQERIAKYYSAADFFLQCSYEESFGQTTLESMACGTPVISTLCGIAKELITSSNGVICKGYDSEAIAAGIEEALKFEYDPSEIRQCVLDNYQYDKIAKQYINLYNNMIYGAV